MSTLAYVYLDKNLIELVNSKETIYRAYDSQVETKLAVAGLQDEGYVIKTATPTFMLLSKTADRRMKYGAI